MALPTTGAIHLSQVGTEARKPLLSAVDMNDIEVRKLCNKTTLGSQISMNDLHGTAYGVGPGYGATDFTSLTAKAPNYTYTSNLIYVYGVGSSPVSFAIFSSSSTSLYRINSGAWADKNTLGQIKDGDTLELQLTTPNAYGGSYSIDAQYGGITKTWSVSVATENRHYYWLYASHDASWRVQVTAQVAVGTYPFTPPAPVSSYTEQAAALETSNGVDFILNLGSVSVDSAGNNVTVAKLMYISCVESGHPLLNLNASAAANNLSSSSNLMNLFAVVNGRSYIEGRLTARANGSGGGYSCSGFGWGGCMGMGTNSDYNA